MKLKKTDGFRAAFAKAKKEGKKTFMWNGKSYTTQTAEEKALKMSDKELANAREEAYQNAKVHTPELDDPSTLSDKARSSFEIANSYTLEEQYRLGDKKKKLRNEGKSTRFYGSAYARPRPSRLKK